MGERVEHPHGGAVRPGVAEGLFRHRAGPREIALPVLVDLCHLLPRAGVEPALRAGRLLPERPRLRPAGAPLLAPREANEQSLAGRPLETALERHAKARLPALGVGALEQV